jgi:hypothetical protein
MTAKKSTLSLILSVAVGLALLSHNGLAGPAIQSPTPLNATIDTTNRMVARLSWANISGETGYLVERKSATSASFSEVAKLGPNVRAYGDITTTSQSYTYRVRAYKAMGAKTIYSSYTNIVAVVTGELPPTSSSSSGTTTGTSSSGGTTTDTSSSSGTTTDTSSSSGTTTGTTSSSGSTDCPS